MLDSSWKCQKDWERHHPGQHLLPQFASVAFHKKNGFVECERFIKIGRKMGQDVVWRQRMA